METISLPLATLVIQALGLPGLVFIIWHFDAKRLQAQREMYELEQAKDRDEYRKQIQLILTQYKEDGANFRRLYENNSDLVKRYDRALERMEKLTSEILSVVSLNTQTMTHLGDAIKNNQFCPTVRKAGA